MRTPFTLIVRIATSALFVVFAAVPMTSLADSKYKPAIRGSSRSSAIEGHISRVRETTIEIRDKEGIRHTVEVLEDTLIVSDDDDVTIANLAKLSLKLADLRIGDRVEVIAEPAPDRTARARILTRISPGGFARNQR